VGSTDGYGDTWYGDCANTYHEETKQIEKARRMGLQVGVQRYPFRKPVIDMNGRSVIDVGGGPVSLLLKCVNVDRPTVLDPGVYPDWVVERYRAAGIRCVKQQAERFAVSDRWDEAWIMNTLRHVEDPEQVIRVARRHARSVRVAEWVNEELMGVALRRNVLDGWLGAEGLVYDWQREDLATQELYVVVASGIS
jgi:hypothetical protein